MLYRSHELVRFHKFFLKKILCCQNVENVSTVQLSVLAPNLFEEVFVICLNHSGFAEEFVLAERHLMI